MEAVINGKTVKANEHGDTWLSKWSKLSPQELKEVAPHLFEVELLSEEMKAKDARIKELEAQLTAAKQESVVESKKEEGKKSKSEIMKEIWAKKRAAAV